MYWNNVSRRSRVVFVLCQEKHLFGIMLFVQLVTLRLLRMRSWADLFILIPTLKILMCVTKASWASLVLLLIPTLKSYPILMCVMSLIVFRWPVASELPASQPASHSLPHSVGQVEVATPHIAWCNQ